MAGLMTETSLRLPENKFEILKSKIMRDSVMEPGFIDGLMNHNQPREYANLANTAGGFLREMFVDPTRNYLKAGAKGVRGEQLNIQDVMHLVEGNTDWGIGASLGSGLMTKGGNPNVASMFVGPSSTDIAKAKTMVAKGLPKEQIQQELLMHKKPDGFWRKEIDDSMSKIVPDNLTWGETEDILRGNSTGTKLGKLLKHQELADSYSDYADINLKLIPDKRGGAFGKDWLGSDEIITGIQKKDATFTPEQKNTIFHELQHAVQSKEGWARGGSPNEFMGDIRTKAAYYESMISKKNKQMTEALDVGDKERYRVLMDERSDLVTEYQATGLHDPISAKEQAFNEYQNLLGEREARSTAERMDMTLDERRGLMPDVGEGATVRMGGGGPSMEIPAWHGSPHRIKGGFKDSAIGTGEGAQAFGYGHYFTDKESVARGYAAMDSRNILTYDGQEYKGLKELNKSLIKEHGADKQDTIVKTTYDFLNNYWEDDILKNVERTDPQNIGVAKNILEGLGRPDTNQGWQLNPKGGTRSERVMTKDEQSTLFELRGRLHWFSENKDVLKELKSDLGKTVSAQKENIEYAKNHYSVEDKNKEIEKSQRYINEAEKGLDLINKYSLKPKYEKGRENLYKTTLHKGKDPSEYDYLEWDKTIPENQLKKLGINRPQEEIDFVKFRDKMTEKYNRQMHRSLVTEDELKKLDGLRLKAEEKNSGAWSPSDGMGIYKHMSNKLGSDKEASKLLLDAGIDGIKYPSGSLSGGNKDNAFNYVVFDPKDISIDEHYINGMMQ